MVKEIKSQEEFEKEVLKSDVPVLVDFWATWCGPCKMLAPVVDKVSQEYSDVKVVKVDVDENPEIAQEYSIMSIPALKIFKNGEVVAEEMGFKSPDQLKSFIDSNK